MKLVDYKVIDFVNEVDSSSPAPGGGSVSALISATSAALARMVGHLTVGKKKYEALDDSIKKEFEESFTKIGSLKDELIILVDEDTDNFNLVMDAYKLPKETDDEKSARSSAIQSATIKATKTPLKVVTLSLEVLKLLGIFIEHGNKNALSDVGVAALLALAGLKGAILNVKINIPSIKDEALVAELKAKCQECYDEGVKISDNIEKKVLEML